MEIRCHVGPVRRRTPQDLVLDWNQMITLTSYGTEFIREIREEKKQTQHNTFLHQTYKFPKNLRAKKSISETMNGISIK